MKKVTVVLSGLVLASVSMLVGFVTAPEEVQMPVLLADGEVILQPYCVMVEDCCVALVDSEETAKKVVEKVEAEYENQDTIGVEVKEKTSTELLHLNNGDACPDILTEEEAVEQMVEEEVLTVKTTEVVTETVSIDYSIIEEKTENLKVGEVELCCEGQKGVKEITKEITKENGEVMKEEVVEETIIKKAVSQRQKVGTSGMTQPLDELRVTSCFGPRWGRQHSGVDFGMYEGAKICAAKAGTVSFSGYSGSYGNLVKIEHGEGLETYYAHCSEILVEEGEGVEAGNVIAKVGSTGNSTGPHLHFEVRMNGEAVDPMDWLTQ